MTTNEMVSKLSDVFPKDAIHWRPGATTKTKDKALALAYIDARDVMDRLDNACGVGNWQSEHFPMGNRVGCRIGIKIDGEWVWKSDGAGDTDVEADKGAFSDAFKRAAVSWGVGRYLYALDAKWLPCEFNGKYFQKWLKDPWTATGMTAPAEDIRGGAKNPAWTGDFTKGELTNFYKTVAQDINSDDIEDVPQLVELMKGYQGELMESLKANLPTYYDNSDIEQPGLKQLYLRRMKQLET